MARSLRESITVAPSVLSPVAKALEARFVKESPIGVHFRSYQEEKVPARRSVPSPAYFRLAVERLFAEIGARQIFIASDAGVTNGWLPASLSEHVVTLPTKLSHYEDFQLLKTCKYHVLCNSSFGWWAAFLADARCVYYPQDHGYFHYPQPAQGWRLLSDPALS